MKKIFENKKLFINCFLVLALMLSSGVAFSKAFSANSYNWQRAENEKYTTYIDSIKNVGFEDVAFIYLPQKSSELLPQGYLNAMQEAKTELESQNYSVKLYTLNPYSLEFRSMRSTNTPPAILTVYKYSGKYLVSGNVDESKLLRSVNLAQRYSFSSSRVQY